MLLLFLWWDHGLKLTPCIFLPDWILFFMYPLAASWKFMPLMNKRGEPFFFVMTDKTWTPNGRGVWCVPNNKDEEADEELKKPGWHAICTDNLRSPPPFFFFHCLNSLALCGVICYTRGLLTTVFITVILYHVCSSRNTLHIYKYWL